MRRLIPAAQLLLFVTVHYLLILGHVPAQNQLPATFGAAALTAMTLAMVLATRFPAIDRLMIGPGRSYRLHRRLAYAGIMLVIGHWILASPVGEGIIPELAMSASLFGQYAALLFIALVLISILEDIPYHIWRVSHYLMGPVYLAVVFHTFFSRIPLVTGDMTWWMLVVISLIGIGSLAWTVVRHFRPTRNYRVSRAIPVKHGIDLRLEPDTKGRRIYWKPGQFATLSFPRLGSEPHPFTICSSARSKELRFVIGNRGDFTSKLQLNIEPGDSVKLSNIAGEFMPDYIPDRQKSQVWVAGGIGITPFLAAIDAMSADNGPGIDLIYCYRSLEWAIDVERLIDAASRLPQLRVHFIGGDVAGNFEHNMLPQLCQTDWQDGDLYVCGPEPLIDLVCNAWRHYKAEGTIHVEIFEFRSGWQLRSPSAVNGTTNVTGGLVGPAGIKSFI